MLPLIDSEFVSYGCFRSISLLDIHKIRPLDPEPCSHADLLGDRLDRY
jgi:hypothetical protein